MTDVKQTGAEIKQQVIAEGDALVRIIDVPTRSGRLSVTPDPQVTWGKVRAALDGCVLLTAEEQEEAKRKVRLIGKHWEGEDDFEELLALLTPEQP